MGNVNQSFVERDRYTLSCPGYPDLVTAEPVGWNQDEKEFTRSPDYDGIFLKLSNNLKFYGDAKEYLRLIYDIEGVNARVTLTKDERHPHNDQWVEFYTGFLDMSTYELENNQVAIKFNSGGLEQTFKARESEQLEIDRETDLDGKTIDPLETKLVVLEGRRIFLQSKWEVYQENNRARIVMQDGIGPHTERVGVPLSLIQKSHEEAQDVSVETYNIDGVGQVGSFFFLESIEPRQMRMYGKLKFIVAGVDVDFGSSIVFSVAFRPYTPSPYYELSETTLFSTVLSPALTGQIITVDFDETIQIARGQSLALEFSLGGNVVVGDQPTIRISGIECTMNDDEDSFYEQTTSKMLLAHEIFERMVYIVSGKKSNFYSEYFGRTDIGYDKTGKGGYVGAAHGWWIRNFDKLPLSTRTNINPFKPFTTSIQDAMQSFAVTHNVGLGIERNGFSERIRIEDKKFFYNRSVTVRLPNPVSNVKRYPANPYNYSSVEIGYEKGGTYEEVMGVDEYNAKSTFTTCITGVVQKLILISKYRADSIGKEITRRKQKFRFGTTDTNGDNDIFVMDLKPFVQGLYAERKWRDDFAEEPTGTYDPGTATNLRFSPFNLAFIRHGWEIAAGLTKYLNKYFTYASSTANSRLETKLRTDSDYIDNDPTATPGNGNSYKEDGNIINSDFEQPRYKADYVEFDHIVNFEVMQQIEGQSIIDGKTVQNKYGLVEFINENGDKEYGFIDSVKPNGAGRVRLICFNG